MSPPGTSEEPDPIELPPPRRTLLRRLTARMQESRSLKAWVEWARRRSRAVDATFETIERDSEIGGVMLAGALSYRLFVFALPLAFFVVSGLGLLASVFGVEPRVISNSIGLAGVVTKQVESASKAASNWWVALTSFLVLVYATRVLLRAIAIRTIALRNVGADQLRVLVEGEGVVRRMAVRNREAHGRWFSPSKACSLQLEEPGNPDNYHVLHRRMRFYQVRAWNPYGWLKYVYFNNGSPICA